FLVLFNTIFYFFFPFLGASTASLRALPAVNLGSFFAAILIVAPVCGFLPLRAARSEIPKVPKPIKVTFSPLDKDEDTAPVKLLTAFSACDCVIPASLAICLIKSVLFIIIQV